MSNHPAPSPGSILPLLPTCGFHDPPRRFVGSPASLPFRRRDHGLSASGGTFDNGAICNQRGRASSVGRCYRVSVQLDYFNYFPDCLEHLAPAHRLTPNSSYILAPKPSLPQILHHVVRHQPQHTQRPHCPSLRHPRPMVLFPLQIQTVEAVVLHTPVPSDQGQDLIGAQPIPSHRTNEVSVLNLYRALSMLGFLLYQPRLPQM